MTPTWRAIAFQVIGVLVVGALLIGLLRASRRDRHARRVTPETGLRPARRARRRKADVRFYVLVGAVLAAVFGAVILERFGSDETRQRLRALYTVLSHGRFVLVGVIALLVATLLVMLWMQRDPALKEVAALATAGRTEEAIEALRRLIAERGETVRRLTALGVLYMDRKRWDEALEQFRRAEAAGAPKLSTTNNVAVVLCRMGRADEGLALLARAAAEHPRNFDVACNQAHFLADAGREAEAYEALERAEDILDQYEPRYVPDYWKRQIEPLRQKLPVARGFPIATSAGPPATPHRPPTDAAS
jgi:tetratricopeptide (TPR) repeat protein